MPNDDTPTLDEFFEYDQMPKPMAPAPEEPMRVNVTTSTYFENDVGQAD